jgi:hypothetical protein
MAGSVAGRRAVALPHNCRGLAIAKGCFARPNLLAIASGPSRFIHREAKFEDFHRAKAPAVHLLGGPMNVA